MPFEIVRNDISAMTADAIVNTAYPKPCVGSGADRAINEKAGPGLLEARREIGDIPVGGAAATAAFGLDAKYVIHTVSPLWQGGEYGESELLMGCYSRALALAEELGCRSIAFPLLAAGNLGFPGELALRCAISAISAFLMEHEMLVTLVVYNKRAFVLSEKLFNSVRSFIDENYVAEKKYGAAPCARDFREHRRRAMDAHATEALADCVQSDALVSYAAAAPLRLEDMLENMDAGFSESLLRLIDERGLTDPEVYKRANIDRKLFSKIKNNPEYRPGKATALAFAIALKLDMEQTGRLLAKAGYALSRSSKFDLIVEYFIRQGCYDIFEINQTLFEFDQPLIGG